MTPNRTTYFALGFETKEDAESAEALLRQHWLGPSTVPFEITLTRYGDVVGDVDAGHAKSWQPIETAPLDGTEVLAYVLGPTGIVYMEVLRFREHWWYDSEGIDCNPTHWMPLPAAPKG